MGGDILPCLESRGDTAHLNLNVAVTIRCKGVTSAGQRVSAEHG